MINMGNDGDIAKICSATGRHAEKDYRLKARDYSLSVCLRHVYFVVFPMVVRFLPIADKNLNLFPG